MLPEPWSTLLFLIIVPFLVQAIKYWREKAQKPLPRWAIQLVAFVFSGVFIFISGGFFGIVIPVCEFAADLVACSGAWVSAIVAGFALVVALYEVVWKAIYEKVGFTA